MTGIRDRAYEMVGAIHKSDRPCLEFILDFLSPLMPNCPKYENSLKIMDLRQYCKIVTGSPKLGDVLILDWSVGQQKVHLGIYIGNSAFIHSNDGKAEITHLSTAWMRRIKSIWRLKENG